MALQMQKTDTFHLFEGKIFVMQFLLCVNFYVKYFLLYYEIIKDTFVQKRLLLMRS